MFVDFRSIWSPLPVVHAASTASQLDQEWTEYYKKFHGVDPDNQTPSERLHKTWQSFWNMKGWEWDLVWMTFHSGFVFAGCIGAMARNEDNKLMAIRKYSEIQFDHPYLANRKMRDQHYMRNIKNGFRFGWRVATISSILVAGSLSSMSYRNYINPLDYAGLGALTSGLWRWQTGPRGMLVSAGIGGCTGLLVGSMVWASFRLCGLSVAEFRVTLGRDFFRRKAEDKKNTLRDFGNNEGLELLAEREQMLLQRRAMQRMREHEAELAAKQKELATRNKDDASEKK